MHPYDAEVKVPPAVAEVITRAAALGPKGIDTLREFIQQKYDALAEELEPLEKLTHQGLKPGVEAVVGQKKIVLFRRMLKDIGYDDLDVAELLVKGIEIVEELGEVGIWKLDPTKAPRISVQSLLTGARQAQKEATAPRNEPWRSTSHK